VLTEDSRAGVGLVIGGHAGFGFIRDAVIHEDGSRERARTLNFEP
jgi:hypothetical protein